MYTHQRRQLSPRVLRQRPQGDISIIPHSTRRSLDLPVVWGTYVPPYLSVSLRAFSGMAERPPDYHQGAQVRFLGLPQQTEMCGSGGIASIYLLGRLLRSAFTYSRGTMAERIFDKLQPEVKTSLEEAFMAASGLEGEGGLYVFLIGPKDGASGMVIGLGPNAGDRLGIGKPIKDFLAALRQAGVNLGEGQ